MNLKPKICNVCGGEVELVSYNKVNPKTKLKNRKCYICKNCGAYVLTDQRLKDIALGTLADKKTRKKRVECHRLLNNLARYHPQRDDLYMGLADELGIEFENSHFGYMDYDMLVKAEKILLRMWKLRYDI